MMIIKYLVFVFLFITSLKAKETVYLKDNKLDILLCRLKLRGEIASYYALHNKISKIRKWNNRSSDLPENFFKGLIFSKKEMQKKYKNCKIITNYCNYRYLNHERNVVFFIYFFKITDKVNKKIFHDSIVMLENMEVIQPIISN